MRDGNLVRGIVRLHIRVVEIGAMVKGLKRMRAMRVMTLTLAEGIMLMMMRRADGEESCGIVRHRSRA